MHEPLNRATSDGRSNDVQQTVDPTGMQQVMIITAAKQIFFRKVYPLLDRIFIKMIYMITKGL